MDGIDGDRIVEVKGSRALAHYCNGCGARLDGHYWISITRGYLCGRCHSISKARGCDGCEETEPYAQGGEAEPYAGEAKDCP